MKLSIIVPLYGDYKKVYKESIELTRELFFLIPRCERNIEFIFVLENRYWEFVLPPSLSCSENVNILISDVDSNLGKLLNMGIKNAKGDLVSFAFAGIKNVSKWFNSLNELLSENSKKNYEFISGNYIKPASIMSDAVYSSVFNVPAGFRVDNYPCGWIEMLSIVPFANSIIKKNIFSEFGYFAEDVKIGRGTWWDFCLRYSCLHEIKFFENAAVELNWDVLNFPENKTTNDVSLNELHRNILKRRDNLVVSEDEIIVESSMSNVSFLAGKKQVRVLVIGGLNEPAHNQIVFFNHFEKLSKYNIFSWRTLLDTACTEIDLVNNDIVIFSRVRSAEGVRYIEFCKRNKIPTIYMLDDNWFSVANDYPEYKHLFTPGCESYENFIKCVNVADRVLTFNDLMVEDLLPHNPNVVKTGLFINMALFPQKIRKPQKRVKIGYVGSSRINEAAFEAIAEIANENDFVDVFVMSNKLPEKFKKVPQKRIEFCSYIYGYRRYAKLVSDKEIDILTAPLVELRTAASKCPNKYFEITAVGAVGVYSNVYPYSKYIEDGKTGVMVSSDSVSEWKKAIMKLVNDVTLRNEILGNAKKDVVSNFYHPDLHVEFINLINSTIDGVSSVNK